jgi:hypothetical protein
MSFFNWSTTASSNQTADSSINLAEGQAPSTLNDASRAIMAAMACWRIDVSGNNQTSGGPTAFTLTTQQNSVLGQPIPSTPATGTVLGWNFNQTPSGTETIAIDSGTAYPIQLGGATPPSGAFVANIPYTFMFSGSAWQGLDYYPVPFTGSVSTSQLPANQIIRSIALFKDGGGQTVTTGLGGYFYVPISATITKWYLVGDGSTGSASVSFIISGSSTIFTATCTSATEAVSGTLSLGISPNLYYWNINSLSTWTKISLTIIMNAS